jgi:predicted membrane protein
LYQHLDKIMNNLHHNSKQSGRAIAGFVLMGIGLVLLLKQFNFSFFPNWLFSWPMILIIVGLVRRANNPNNQSWLILILVGCLFLLEKMFPSMDVFDFGWPVIIIAVGFWLIFRRSYDFNTKNTTAKEAYANDDFLNPQTAVPNEEPLTEHFKAETSESFLNAFSIFSSVKKNVLSKNFRGGEIVNIFGGTDIDFSHADINGQVVVDVVQLFGGTKLIVPPHWQVVADIAQIFGGVNDKRIPHADVASSGKVLVLKGTSIFGGVDIKSF